jgi:hypothetical protein
MLYEARFLAFAPFPCFRLWKITLSFVDGEEDNHVFVLVDVFQCLLEALQTFKLTVRRLTRQLI